MQSDVLGPKLSCDQNRPRCLTLRDERTRQGMPDRLMKAKGRTMSMHADEESDEVVLPVKRSNNEGLSSAETVEGRAFLPLSALRSALGAAPALILTPRGRCGRANPAVRGSCREFVQLLHHVAEIVAVHVRRRHLQVFHHLLELLQQKPRRGSDPPATVTCDM